MTTPHDQLKGTNRASTVLALPYGYHVDDGHLIMSGNYGSVSPNHQISFRQALGEGVWDSILVVYYDGTYIDPANYVFYDGTQTGAPTSPFAGDYAHFGTAMLDVHLPTGMGDADDKGSPPSKLAAFSKCLKIDDYDSDGTVTGNSYSPGPARVTADMILKRGRLTNNAHGDPWVNWTRWCAWRDYNNGTETVDYRTIANFDGIGLKGYYYNSTTIGTSPVLSRTDPIVYFDTSSGAPARGLTATAFSVRWSGYVKPKTTGTYTFRMQHDDGVTLTINGTAVVNNAGTGSHSGTISLTAGTFYTLQLDWVNTSGPSQCIMYWTPPSESEVVVPQEALYPITESKPRYETHLAFTSPTNLDDGIRTVLLNSNSFVQQADGQLNFYNFEEHTTPVLDFNNSNVAAGTFQFYRRDHRDLVNRLEAQFRDLESAYLEAADPPLAKDYQSNQDDQGRVINASPISLGNTTHWQAQKVLDFIGKRDVEMDLFMEFDGDKSTFIVLPGDLVTVTWDELSGDPIQCVVLQTTDYSPEETPDRRGFVLMEWT